MALASMTYQWPDGTSIELVVDSDDGMAHPDLLDEVVRRVLVLYRAACVEGEQ